MSTPPIVPDSASQNLFPQDPMNLQTPIAHPEQQEVDSRGDATSSGYMGKDSLTQQAGGELFLGDLEPGTPLLQVPKQQAEEQGLAGQQSEGIRTNAQFVVTDANTGQVLTEAQLEAAGFSFHKGGPSLSEFNASVEQMAKTIYVSVVGEFPPAVQNAIAATEEADAIYEQTGVRPSNEEVRPSELGSEEIPIEEARWLMSWGKLIAKVLALVSQMKGMMANAEAAMTAEEAKREVENYKAEMIVIKEEIRKRIEKRKEIREMARKFGVSVDALLAMATGATVGAAFLVVFSLGTIGADLLAVAAMALSNAAIMKTHGPGNDLGSTLAKMFGGDEEDSWIGQIVSAILTQLLIPGVGTAMSAIMTANAVKDKQYFEAKANKPRNIAQEGMARIHDHNIRIAQLIRMLAAMMEQQEEQQEIMALLMAILTMLVQMLDMLKGKGGKGGGEAVASLPETAASQGATSISALAGVESQKQGLGEMIIKAPENFPSDKFNAQSESIQEIQTQEAERMAEASAAIAKLPDPAILTMLEERVSILEEVMIQLESQPDMPEEEKKEVREVMVQALKDYVDVLQGATEHYIYQKESERDPDFEAKILNGLVDGFYKILPDYPQSPAEFIAQLDELQLERNQTADEIWDTGLNAFLGHPNLPEEPPAAGESSEVRTEDEIRAQA